MSVKRHSIYNLAGSLLPLATSLVTVPLYLEEIGTDRYGLLAIVWVLVGYFGLFEFGLGRAVTNRIAKTQAKKEYNPTGVFWSSLLASFGLGIFAATLLWLVGIFLFRDFIQTADDLRLESLRALPWIIFAFPVILSAGIPIGLMSGWRQFFGINLLRSSEGTLLQLIPLLAAVYWGPTMKHLVIAVVAVKLFHFLIAFLVCVWQLPRGSYWAFDDLKCLFRFGGWLTVSGIVGPIMVSFDRIMIGVIAGTSAVAFYTVPYGLANKLMVIPVSLTTAIFPVFSHDDKTKTPDLSREAINVLAAIVTPMAIGGLIIMRPFLTAWVGTSFAENSAHIGEIIALGVWACCLAQIPHTLLLAKRVDIPAKIHLGELVPYLVSMVALIWMFGAIGAAIAWSTRCVVDALLHFKFSGLGWNRQLAWQGLLIGTVFVLVQFLQTNTPIEIVVRLMMLVVCAFLLRGSFGIFAVHFLRKTSPPEVTKLEVS